MQFETPVVLTGSAFQSTVWMGTADHTRRRHPFLWRTGREDRPPAAVPPWCAKVTMPDRGGVHRVIGADGALTGYGGGLWRKQKLLDLERGATTKR